MAGKRYSPADRESGYAAIILADGNCALANRELAAAGVSIPRGTLTHWWNHEREAIEDLRLKIGPQLEERRAQRLEALATSAAEVTEQLLQRTRDTADELTAKDIPGAARNIATVLGITTEKGQLLRQRPTSITQHDYSAAMKGLERLGLTVEGTADEIPDAESVGLITAGT